MTGTYLFKGYSKSGKRIHVYLNDGRVDIWYIDTMTRKRWNSEYYTDDQIPLIRDSLISEGFRLD